MGRFDAVCPPCLQVGEQLPHLPPPRLRRLCLHRSDTVGLTTGRHVACGSTAVAIPNVWNPALAGLISGK